MTIIELPHQIDLADAAICESIALPARFDVHEVEDLAAAVPAHAARVELDASAVEMIDHAGLDALVELAGRVDLGIVAASTAFHATVHFTGTGELERLLRVDAPLVFPIAKAA